MKTISLGNKLEKVRLLLELKDSSDPVVKHAKPRFYQKKMGRITSSASGEARLENQEVVGSIQHSRADFGWTTSTKMWSKTTKIEMKRLNVQEVMKEEEESYKVKAVSKYLQSSHTSMGSDDAIQIT